MEEKSSFFVINKKYIGDVMKNKYRGFYREIFVRLIKDFRFKDAMMLGKDSISLEKVNENKYELSLSRKRLNKTPIKLYINKNDDKLGYNVVHSMLVRNIYDALNKDFSYGVSYYKFRYNDEELELIIPVIDKENLDYPIKSLIYELLDKDIKSETDEKIILLGDNFQSKESAIIKHKFLSNDDFLNFCNTRLNYRVLNDTLTLKTIVKMNNKKLSLLEGELEGLKRQRDKVDIKIREVIKNIDMLNNKNGSAEHVE